MARSDMCGDTGNLATITFTSGIVDTLKVRFIDPSEESIGSIDCSHLGTTVHRTLVKEDLSDTPELSIEWIWDTFDTVPVVGMALGVTTVTYPLRTAGATDETTPATRAGDAYIAAVKHPRLENNVLQVGSMKVKFTTTPTYTKST